MLSTNRLSVETSESQVVEIVSIELEKLKKIPSFSLIVPVYNEVDIVSKNLDVLETFLKRESYELIIYDDCSKDGTYLELKDYEKHSENSNLLMMHTNSRIGKGGTIKKAVKAATGEIVVLMDVDLSADLKRIPDLIRQVRKSEGLVIGQRSISDRYTQGVLRVMLSLGYNSLVRLLFRTGIKDHQCGFKAMKTEVARRLMAIVRSDSFVFDTELIVLAKKAGIPVQEVEVKWGDSRQRKSNLKWLIASLVMMKDLISIWRNIHGNLMSELHEKNRKSM